MSAISSHSGPVLSPPAPAAAAVCKRDLAVTLLEYFLRFLVVALGIGIGFIVAVIVGFVTGWISIEC